MALGYTLVYGILQLINFAHGDVFALSGLVAYSISINLLDLTGHRDDRADRRLALTLVLAAAFAASLNFTIEFLAYRRLRDQPRLTMLITAVGMSFIVSNIALYFYGVRFYSASILIQSGAAFSIGDITVRWNQLVVILITIPVLLILTWLVKSTKQGKGCVPSPRIRTRPR